jgi:hypothetical protein
MSQPACLCDIAPEWYSWGLQGPMASAVEGWIVARQDVAMWETSRWFGEASKKWVCRVGSPSGCST